MKKLLIIILMATASLVLGADDEWLNKHAAITTTETVEKDGNGIVKSLRIVKDTIIYIKQSMVEIHRLDKSGEVVPVSRTTTSLDTLGGSMVIVEGWISGAWMTTGITTTEKKGERLETVVFSRNKSGKMEVVNRKVSVVTGNGQAVVL